jgi:hypothetical protein
MTTTDLLRDFATSVSMVLPAGYTYEWWHDPVSYGVKMKLRSPEAMDRTFFEVGAAIDDHVLVSGPTDVILRYTLDNLIRQLAQEMREKNFDVTELKDLESISLPPFDEIPVVKVGKLKRSPNAPKMVRKRKHTPLPTLRKVSPKASFDWSSPVTSETSANLTAEEVVEYWEQKRGPVKKVYVGDTFLEDEHQWRPGKSKADDEVRMMGYVW